MTCISLSKLQGLSDAEVTATLQKAIDETHQKGGGTVCLKAGKAVCGSLELRSGVELCLAHGSELTASGDPALFPPLADHDPSITANSKAGALIQAKGADNIALTGTGRIRGGGEAQNKPDWKTAQDLFRPGMVYLEDCEGVRFENISLLESRWWTMHLRRCRKIRVRGVTMNSTWPNSDGIDPDGCRDILISDCHLICGDDCIVVKSTNGDNCENMVVTNCLLETSCAALKVGTESFGAFRNITLSNCVCRSHVGVGIYLKDGGLAENIQASNLVLDCYSAYPILMDAMPRYYDSGKPAGHIRNIRVSNCTVRSGGRVWIEGDRPGAVTNISLHGIDWTLTEPLPEKPLPKPAGSARITIDPDRPAFEENRSHIIARQVENLKVGDWSLSGADADQRQNPLVAEVKK